MRKADVQTVSGDIIAPQVREGGDLETVSGQIHLSGGPYADVSMNTVSGRHPHHRQPGVRRPCGGRFGQR